MNGYMKRLLCLALLILCVLPVLASCGDRPTVNTKVETPTPSTQTPILTETPVATETPTTETPATETPVTETPTAETPVVTETPVITETPSTETPVVTETPVPTETVVPTETPIKDPWLLHETADAGMDYQNKLIFLGDSTTAGMIAYKVLPGEENTKQVWRGAEGNTITFLYVEDVKILYPETDEKLTILEAVARKKPEYLVVTLGVTGGVSQDLKKESFLGLYKWLLDGIMKQSPDTTLIVQSIFPVNEEIWDSYKRITNEKIAMTNEWIKEMVAAYHADGKKIFYADTYPALLDEKGYMKKEYGNGDGLHLSAAGYAVVLNYLRTHAVTLQ